MSKLDILKLREWVGKTASDHDVLSVRHARLMAATVGADTSEIVEGAPLPPLWHWIYFLEGLPAGQLGHDGHPLRGGFLPPVPLPNRMWAGGRVEFHGEVVLGAQVEKHSSILSVEHKQGRSGELVFVTVRHEISDTGKIVISEEHDIVYKDASPGRPQQQDPGWGAQENQETPETPRNQERFLVTSTTLFRYSALTFNGHRIHYDQDYCREVEGYPNLVIHGPLSATLLAGYAQRLARMPLRTFRYRGVQPAFLGSDLTLNATRNDDGYLLWTGLPDARVSMRAEATFERHADHA